MWVLGARLPSPGEISPQEEWGVERGDKGKLLTTYNGTKRYVGFR